MTYFTKYLPVEGEIKEGALCIKKNTTTLRDTWTIFRIKGIMPPTNVAIVESVVCGQEPYLCDKIFQDILDITKEKKVKLFLCSRDIQVGDTIIGNRGDEVKAPVDLIENGYIYCGPLSIRWEVGKAFKKIGEISPDATWVKEGMELDETEIEYKDTRMDDTGLKFLDTYAVMGKCGYFH